MPSDGGRKGDEGNSLISGHQLGLLLFHSATADLVHLVIACSYYSFLSYSSPREKRTTGKACKFSRKRGRLGVYVCMYVCVCVHMIGGYYTGTSSLALFGLLRRRPLNDETASGDVVKGVERARLALGLAFTLGICLLYTSPSPRDRTRSRMPSSA